MFAVAGEAQQVGHDHLRTVARAGGRDGVLHGVQARAEIGAVRRMPGETVPGRAVEQIVAGVLPTRRRGVGILVVRHDDDHRQAFDRRHVHALVESSRGRAAVADARRADDAVEPCPASAGPRSAPGHDGRPSCPGG